ncbi:hypothetical protein [Novosphingobium terrae]|uniref:hypothetical protein n=1 Tax=Novosphingobium terrae TaxID=2726189 RepID=UPI00197CFD64|nr:hypothetical protein [Novosphingobium terrae]
MLEGADGIIAVFFGQPTLKEQPDAPDIWATLFDGAKPDAYNRNTSGPFPISTANGQWNSAKVQVTAQIGRIDLQWNALPGDEMGRPQQFPDIEAWVEKACTALKCLAGSMRAVRLALVVNTSSKIPEGDPAVALSKLLGKVSFPPHGSDLLYRVNVQRSLLAAPSIKLNRLSTWQSGAHQLFAFNPTASAPAVLEAINYISHNVDINTLGVLDPAHANAEEIINEMYNEAISILKLGRSFYD